MTQKIFLYNTLSRSKEEFVPIKAPFVGLYVCGPTVYGDPHLGHARSALTFDILFRLLKYSGYKVRYVRNITDVGHLVGDADEGDDKIARIARVEQVEPMEVATYYTNRYQEAMKSLGMLPPSIEPRASGHILEQIELVEKILERDLAYVSDGSVYFDVRKYNETNNYGLLSGRNLDDIMEGTRELQGQEGKRFAADFALWKKADPTHIMRWKSPWSLGFPGWHAECTAMSAKYLGEEFDIHGGGMDLVFPHHECEIAQSTAANHTKGARYWVHNNMITFRGQKMGKSLGNAISLEEFFNGSHPLLEGNKYEPLTIRFFILSAHYRSTLDFSNEALLASQKGLERLLNAQRTIAKLRSSSGDSSFEGDVSGLLSSCLTAIADDMNTPVAISILFDWVKVINSVYDGHHTISATDLEVLRQSFDTVLNELLGLQQTVANEGENTVEILDSVMNLVLELRSRAKEGRDFATSDLIRDKLKEAGIQVNDRKDKTSDYTVIG